MKNREKVYFGWYVLFATCISNLLVIGIMGNCSSNYLVPVTSEMGISRSLYSLFPLIYAVASGVFTLYIFRIFAKCNYRRIMVLSSAIFCISYMSYGLVTSLWQIYAIAAVSGVSGACMGAVVVTTAIGNWFHEKKGIVLAIAFSSSGIGGAVLNPVIANLILDVGWRLTYFYIGLGMLVLAVPVIAAYYVLTPEEKNLRPYRKRISSGNETTGETQELHGITCMEAMRTKEFWSISIAFTMLLLSTMMIMLHYIPILTSKELAVEQYSLIASAMMLSIVLGKFLLGYLLDKFNSKIGIVLFSAFYISAYTIMFFSKQTMPLLISGVLFGMALSVTTILPPHVIYEMYGRKEYGNIFARANMIGLIGVSGGGFLSGILYDMTGDYSRSILVALGLVVGALVILVTSNLKKMQQKEVPL